VLEQNDKLTLFTSQLYKWVCSECQSVVGMAVVLFFIWLITWDWCCLVYYLWVCHTIYYIMYKMLLVLVDIYFISHMRAHIINE